jgi:DNA polymerase-3 subunit alpha
MINETDFIHLRVRSSYSLAQGAIKIDELVRLSAYNKMPAVAITDDNNLYGSLEFSMEALKKSVQPIIGCIFSIDPAEKPTSNIINEQYFDNIILYAKDKTGYQNLLKLVSHCRTRISDLPPHIKFSELENLNQGLICLTANHDGTVGRLLLEDKNSEAESFLLKLKKIFADRLYIELMRHNILKEQKIEERLLDLAYKHHIPIVATNDVYFASREMYEAHDALTCIAGARYIIEEDRHKLNPEYYFKSAAQMKELFADLPEAIINSVKIAKRCYVKSEEHAPIMPHFNEFSGLDEAEQLRQLTRDGLKFRLESKEDYQELVDNNQIQAYYDRLDYELNMIINMNFPGYFLIVSDFIKWSKRNNVPVGPGRGSGAGSLVAWSLEITNLDPIKFGLFFERFLNPERVSMPDFDIDFCQDKRDLVINYVQEKYGKDRVAQIITFGKLQAKAVIRDVGRVMQIPYSQVDRISKMVPFNAVNPVSLAQAIEMEPELKKAQKDDPQIDKLLSIALQLEGLNRHSSTHAAGIVISGAKLEELVPIERDEKTGMLVVQYSMKYAEAAGLVKFDFLGLKTLTMIDNACNLIRGAGTEINIENISLHDKKTYELLSRGEAVGVFQFESPGMRDSLRKLCPDYIEHLIALGALYRPGPMDNIPTYIACKNGLEEPDYLHPKLSNILRETYGVIIYQEQVMEIAKTLAGYTLGAADLLRRAMGKKIKAEMDAQRQLFVEGSVNNGVDKKQASDIFDLVAKFAGYGFNKSHAAAYAMISYQTAYLKANFLIEFLVASINLDIDDTDKIGIFFQEAYRGDIAILKPDINQSKALFSIETQDDGTKAIRYGLGAIKNVGVQSIIQLEQYRKSKGDFKDIFDFAIKVDQKILNKRQMEKLIKAGAFDSLNSNRRNLLESLDVIIRYHTAETKEKSNNQFNLFKNSSAKLSDVKLLDFADWDEEDKLEFEKEALGFYLTGHPLDKYKDYFNKLDISYAKDLQQNLVMGHSLVKLSGVFISSKNRMTPKGRFVSVLFSDPSGNFEVSIFDDKILQASRDLLASKLPLVITAEARKDDGGIRLTAQSIVQLYDFIHKKFNQIVIWVNEVSIVEQLASLCSGNNKGVTISIIVNTKDKEVEIKIPDHFRIKASDIATLSKLKTIEKIEFRTHR